MINRYFIRTFITCSIILVIASCETIKNSSSQKKGVAIGATSGAVLGGIIGNNVGNKNNTALGAILGAAIGGVAEKIFIDYPDTDILIEGHTDNIGSKSYNNSLSQRRALAVSTALTNEGVNSSRFKTKWYGESQPIVENNSAENRASNRRVEFVITANEKMKAAAKNATN
jgi:hypothetical protein